MSGKKIGESKIRAVMFDLDGTLLDTAPDFVAVVNQLLIENQRAPLPSEKIRACVSNGARALVMMAFNIEESHEDFAHLRARLLELYTQHIAVHTQAFPGIIELLQQLDEKNIAWGIATNKPWLYTEPLMAAINLQPAAKTIVCPEHVTRTKPDPEALFLASEEIGCAPEEMIYVGDHARDIECGKRAKCITIAAAYGYVENQGEVDSWQADYTVNHASEIWPIVKQHLVASD